MKLNLIGEKMNDIKEKQVNDLYHEFLFYSEDLDKLARILVRILPRRMISRIIGKLRRILHANKREE